MSKLQNVLASSYALMIKTHNYHWNIEGRQFLQLHELFEREYLTLFDAVDLIAERIRTFSEKAEAGLASYQRLSVIDDAKMNISSEEMIADYVDSLAKIVALIQDALSSLDNDPVTEGILIDRIETHEKAKWMFESLLK